ncbi:MAG TPA: toll/interleukin-1 receptor domain-containing protein, partial [Pyrinomonadaceae bacterium]
MGYVPGFEHDIFISYAHVDNTSTEDKDGWVTRLHASLLKLIPQKIGRAENFSIWRDRKLGGNDEFVETLDAAFRRSALMLTILTPSYLASTWCGKELDGFTSQPHSKFGRTVGDKNRVFKVMPSPHIPPDEHPVPVRGSLGYQFYTMNEMTGTEERFRRTTEQDPDQRFWLRLDDLARDIAFVLKKMRDIAMGKDPGTVTPAFSGPVVYLAEVTDDLIDQRDEI